MLARAATWTYSRDTELKFDWVGVYMYDGQGFLVKKDLGVSKLAELDGASICVSAGTTTELNLADYFRTHNLAYTPIVANSREQNLARSEEHTSELQSLMRISYAVFCLKKKTKTHKQHSPTYIYDRLTTNKSKAY